MIPRPSVGKPSYATAYHIFCSERFIGVTHVICATHRVLSDLITLTMLEKGYKLFNFLLSVGKSQCFALRRSQHP